MTKPTPDNKPSLLTTYLSGSTEPMKSLMGPGPCVKDPCADLGVCASVPPFGLPAVGDVREPDGHKDGDPLKVEVRGDSLVLGPVSISFQRTLRIPDDGKTYPLPPGLGAFPIRLVSDYADRVPESWRRHGGVFLPLYQREAMWLHFDGQPWRPNALKVGVGKVNALTGRPWADELSDDPQDYLVVPEQPWLDGINAGKDMIRQFVAMPLGMGYTVEGQVTGEETHGGIQLCLFEPRAGAFPDRPPAPGTAILRGLNQGFGDSACYAMASFSNMADGGLLASEAPRERLASDAIGGMEMGMAGGGRMRQKLYPDSHGLDTWDPENYTRVFVHVCNSQMWREITGEAPPESPVSAASYSDAGLPWFDLYDESKGDVEPSKTLAKVKSVKEMDAEKGFTGQQDDSSVEVPDGQVHKYKAPQPAKPAEASLDGDW